MLEFKYTQSNMIACFINTRLISHRVCPHCGGTYTILYGKYNSRQRYLCKCCNKTFSNFTDTPFAGAHSLEKWECFIEHTLKGTSLRASAKELKVSYVTLFYWRHKLLAALKEIKPNHMKATVELQNFYLKYSEKEQRHSDAKNKRVHDKSMSYFNIESDKVCVLFAMDLFENIFSRAVCRGHLKNTDLERSIGKLLNKDNIVYSKSKHLFSTFLRRMNIKESEKTLDNTSMVIKYIKDCMVWMSRFKGVATKYLNNYLMLYKFLKSICFDETLSGVNSMLEVLTTVSIKNTYVSVRNMKLYT